MSTAQTAVRAFRERFDTRPEAISYAPGRVNLIGEHIDYHQLTVLPMALSRGLHVAFRPRDDALVRFVNQDAEYGERSFEIGSRPDTEGGGDWAGYLRAATLTVSEQYGVGRGMDACVASDLPVAAGLSSSSALVVAVAQALLEGAGVIPDRTELAAVLASGERHVGTEGGGMDQAVSLGGRPGHALRIDFEPLRWQALPMPESWTVLVAHSGVRAEKSGGARTAYNERRRIGAEARVPVARELGDPAAEWRELLEVHGTEAVLAAAAAALDPLSLQRVRHVVTEVARVERAEGALRAGDLTAFGAALSASHRSLRDDYQVSHPALDSLVLAADEAGAAGARLTGAGFGGCIVAVSGPAEAASVTEALRGRSTLVFAASAGSGAEVRTLGASS